MSIWLGLFLTFAVVLVAIALCVWVILQVIHYVEYCADHGWQTLLGIIFGILAVSAIIPTAMLTVAWVVER